MSCLVIRGPNYYLNCFRKLVGISRIWIRKARIGNLKRLLDEIKKHFRNVSGLNFPLVRPKLKIGSEYMFTKIQPELLSNSKFEP